MHPEIVSDKPGHCPKCGMALVLKEEKPKMKMGQAEDMGLGILTWRNYIPLIVIILMITLSSLVLSREKKISDFIFYFMTGFFLVFSSFKLMDLKGFAEGYSTYDLLAKRWFGYGYVYPFIELAFGLLMLSGVHSGALLWSEFIVMSFSGLGVAIKMAHKEELMCVCLGTFLKVPLTKITLIEDLGMSLLALSLIFIK